MASNPSNDGDRLDDLMQLETGFYDEGYKTGLEDGTQAGLIEGKLFGIEKGHEKALEMGRLRGRAMVWNSRLSEPSQTATAVGANSREHDVTEMADSLPRLQKSDRLRKQVEALMQIVDSKLDITNSDEAVAAFDNLLIKARNKAKIISSITGETLSLHASDRPNSVIEDALGLSARH